MKTKTLFFAVIFITLTSWISTAHASHQHIYLNQEISWFYFCDGSVDTLIIHRPSNGITSKRFRHDATNQYYFGADSVIVTNTQQGRWVFYSEETDTYQFFIYFLTSPPYTPTTTFTDSNFCNTTFSYQLDAQNTESGATYVWDDNSTNRYRTITSPGTYTVNITNACGSTSASVNITQGNDNAANLGPDITVCYGEIVTLNPGVANIAVINWSTGIYTHTIDVDTTGIYTVYVYDQNACESRDTIVVTMTLQPRIEMCDVSYDTITDRNSINWFVMPGADIDSIRIWVKNNMGVFVNMATVPYTDERYIHWGSTPQADFNEYYITGVNGCGEGPPSTINKSIWLTTLQNELQWQNYQGSFVPLYYMVFAKHINGNVEVIDTIPACSAIGCINHAPIINDPTIAKYFVGFQHDCTSNKSTSGWVISNYYIAIPDNIREQAISYTILPNPATNSITIEIGYERFQANIYDMLGQVVLTQANTKTLDISHLPRGVYVISITADGKTTQKKLIKK